MAAASRKEEERNERIVRGLIKLPPNRRCINCNAIGPQHVCTSFWTFTCISCSGIHREFTHRVKSVSMSNFTVQEVEALQKGGNQRARELLLKDFDTQQMRLPDNSNIESLREFIKAVYVERRYAGVSFSERPPRDRQIQKSHGEEHRRASSYHSFSQSPPNDYQYEERRNGKQPAVLSRKPGSDRGHDGKMPGFAYRSLSLQDRMSEDQFANESGGPRTSGCSGSSLSGTFGTAPKSPDFFDDGCLSPPVQQNQSNMLNSNGITQSQRAAPTGKIDSISLKSGNSSLGDLLFDFGNVHGTQQTNNFVAPSFVAFSDAVNGTKEDLFSQPNLQQQPVTGYPSVDLFANMPHTASSADKMPLEAPSMGNVGWATFDTPPNDKQPGVTGPSPVADIGNDKKILGRDLFSFEPSDRPTLFLTSKHEVSISNQSGATSLDTGGSQLWHSFDDATGIMSNDHAGAEPLSNERTNVTNVSLTRSNPFTCPIASKESHDDDCHQVFMDELALSAPFTPFLEPSPISAVPPGKALSDQVLLNPFDLPFGTDSEATDLFMDMSTLQAALPNLPISFLDGLPESWFSNNTSTYVPSESHGGLPCLIEQAPNSPLRNITLSTVSTGNPFA
ncbi:putative ADP-ribosylation factor GTPase-activating protein AGD14 [Hordeum vulgare]|nr:putative ADP-ribosylation factor GTPase-activating protein AGD14 [Hordeum vulgare]